MANVLEVRALTKTYAAQCKQPGVVALQGIDFSVAAGSCLGLLGPNGAGKTTTLEIIEGTQHADSGEIRLFGQPRTAQYRYHIGILFQHTALPDRLTVLECLQLFSGLYRSGTQAAQPQRIEQLIDRFTLGDLLHRFPQKLSGGQCQRVLLAIALLHDPAILCLDEPTTGLDPGMRQQFWELINQIKAQGTAIVLSTHYMQEAQSLCDQIAMMHQGKIVAQGSVSQLLAQHSHTTLIRLPADLSTAQRSALPFQLKDDHDSPCFVTTDVEHSIDVLRQCGIALRRVHIVPPSLDELYIRLTHRPGVLNDTPLD